VNLFRIKIRQPKTYATHAVLHSRQLCTPRELNNRSILNLDSPPFIQFLVIRFCGFVRNPPVICPRCHLGRVKDYDGFLFRWIFLHFLEGKLGAGDLRIIVILDRNRSLAECERTL